MVKEWSKKKVADHHGYNWETRPPIEQRAHRSRETSEHLPFYDWLDEQFKNEELAIFDIGCGTADVPLYLTHSCKYVGIDINETVLDFAKKRHEKLASQFYETGTRDVTFFLQDIEKDIKEEVLQEIKNCQICYVDGVLRMLENPKKVLQEILIPNFDFIFLNRTPTPSKTLEKSSHKWGGMDNPSVLWHFNADFFKEIAEESDVLCDIGDRTVGVIYCTIFKKASV